MHRPVMIETMKRCNCCKKLLDKLLHFTTHGQNYGDGFVARCKACINKAKKSYPSYNRKRLQRDIEHVW